MQLYPGADLRLKKHHGRAESLLLASYGLRATGATLNVWSKIAMAWAHRTSGSYYYRSVRQGSRVTKTYLGTGLLGELAEFFDAEERAERQDKGRRAWQQTRKDMEALDAQFSAWWNTRSAIIDATLTANGYYRHHRGAWRKRADPKALRQLLNKANKGNKQAFDTCVYGVPGTAWFWEEAGNMAYQAQEACSRPSGRKCPPHPRSPAAEMCGPAPGPGRRSPTPIERLLVDRIVLCWLHLHYAEALYAQNMLQLSLMQHEFYQRRLSMAQRRYLSAITALAQVRRLQVPNVQVNIAEQQLNVAAIATAQPHQPHAERTVISSRARG